MLHKPVSFVLIQIPHTSGLTRQKYMAALRIFPQFQNSDRCQLNEQSAHTRFVYPVVISNSEYQALCWNEAFLFKVEDGVISLYKFAPCFSRLILSLAEKLVFFFLLVFVMCILSIHMSRYQVSINSYSYFYISALCISKLCV